MLNFAIVGCGRIAKKHAEILGEHQLKNARLAAVCDITAEKARYYGEKYMVPWFTDLHEMMRESGAGIDVVTILTESGNHAANTMELAPYGKHIVVEKPMARFACCRARGRTASTNCISLCRPRTGRIRPGSIRSFL